jgi:hypothetical protein
MAEAKTCVPEAWDEESGLQACYGRAPQGLFYLALAVARVDHAPRELSRTRKAAVRRWRRPTLPASTLEACGRHPRPRETPPRVQASYDKAPAST